jgi:PAB1-binding protein PBP1
MFCESGDMQISAANLLIASQQVSRGGAQPAAQPAQFASALKDGGEVDGFAPMEFKAAAPAKAQPAASPASAPQSGYGGATRIGANIDIRV